MTNLATQEQHLALNIIEELDRREKHQGLITSMYPNEGPLRRELYPKHMEFFEAGATYRERCAISANRVGKTEGKGGYETALHLTGLYPEWWPGRRFDRPIDAWVAGKTTETTRDIVQQKLLGGRPDSSDAGTMLVPKDCLGDYTMKPNTGGLVDKIKIKHVDGWSTLGFKCYEQGRGAFEGTEKDLIWFDEEPKMEVYNEALIRTATTGGMTMITFTPLEGLSDVVMSFLPQEYRLSEA